jgi:putative membrane protein
MNEEEQAAGRRTDLAEDRTLLANERTFGGWLRTGLAAVGIGVGFHALFRTVEPPWVPKAIASVFVLAGVLIFWAGERRALQVRRRLEAHQIKLVPHASLVIMASLLTGASIALIAAIWLLV